MARQTGVRAEIFWTFLKLGLTSFGGPIAHIGYFRTELVLRRRWITETAYADLIALCQFLPGPTSSQVGFSLGVLRAGNLLGGIAAWLGFTAPSALFLFAAALGTAHLNGALAQGVLHGLKLVAVAVVAQAIWGMARTLTPDPIRAGVALAAAIIVAGFQGPLAQIAAIGIGALAGLAWCRPGTTPFAGRLDFPVSKSAGASALICFAAFLLIPPLFARAQPIQLFDAFYRSGALVFGGGHVVLPLLQAATVGRSWLSNQTFLAGYGLTQAVPGPLFTFAAYLGAAIGPNHFAGAAMALAAIFLPGLLLVYGMLPFWDALRPSRSAQAAMRGANAAVVGILIAAFCNPVWTGAVHGPLDFGFALAGFLLLTLWKLPPWLLVAGLAAAGAAGG